MRNYLVMSALSTVIVSNYTPPTQQRVYHVSDASLERLATWMRRNRERIFQIDLYGFGWQAIVQVF